MRELLNEDTELYWQSEGTQPHEITFVFHEKVRISKVEINLSHKVDESYTPSTI